MWVFKSRGCRTSSASYLKVILQLLPLVLFFYSYRVFFYAARFLWLPQHIVVIKI